MRGRMLLRTVFFIAVVCQALLASADDPINVSDRKQLFIDNRFIAASENVELRQYRRNLRR